MPAISTRIIRWTQKHLSKLVVLALSLLICGFCFFIHRQHFIQFDMDRNDLLYRFESKVLDAKLRMRGYLKPSSKVGVLAIDDYSLSKLGRWPFSRKYYAKAFENLNKLGVSWIGFDMVFSEPELESLRNVVDRLKNLSHRDIMRIAENGLSDQEFAQGIKAFEKIVLGYNFMGSPREAKLSFGEDSSRYFQSFDSLLSQSSPIIANFPNGKSLNDYPILIKAHAINNNIPIIAKSSEYSGFFSNNADDDAVNRWVSLLANIKGELLPALALRTAARHLNAEIVVEMDTEGVGVKELTLVSADESFPEIKIPTDNYGYGRILLNPIGGDMSLPHFSFAKAYENSFTEKEKQALKGMSLLLGPTSSGINDQRPNAFDSTINGVENHAHVIENIITNNFLKRPNEIVQIEWMILIGSAGLMIPMLLFSSALFSGVALILVLSALFVCDYYFWFGKGIWAYMFLPSAQIVLIYMVATLVKFVFEEREKRKVRSTFGQYLSPDVISQVLEDPESQKLGGQRRDVTIFFSDVRGFTDISEKLSAEKLGELMNAYFNAMTPAILASAGTLDKFIGDAIMAFWGAPLQQSDQADRACRSSIQMLLELPKIKNSLEKIGISEVNLDIGIGLNSGPASIGNFGSTDRFCYTAMGDSVNLSSRLESLTKKFGVKILVSEMTRQKVNSKEFFFRDLAIITVKGKEQPVRVFELMHPQFLPSESQIREFIQIFEAGRESFQTRDFAKAHKYFEKCLELKQADVPSKQYIDDIAYYQQNPPSDSWDGVKRFHEK